MGVAIFNGPAGSGAGPSGRGKGRSYISLLRAKKLRYEDLHALRPGASADSNPIQSNLVHVDPVQIHVQSSPIRFNPIRFKMAPTSAGGAAATPDPPATLGRLKHPGPPFKSAFGLRSSLAIASSLARYRELQKAGGAAASPAPPPQIMRGLRPLKLPQGLRTVRTDRPVRFPRFGFLRGYSQCRLTVAVSAVSGSVRPHPAKADLSDHETMFKLPD